MQCCVLHLPSNSITHPLEYYSARGGVWGMGRGITISPLDHTYNLNALNIKILKALNVLNVLIMFAEKLSSPRGDLELLCGRLAPSKEEARVSCQTPWTLF